MKIKRMSSGLEFEVSKEEWNVILGNGNAYKYQIMEDDTPLEIRALRASKVELPVKKKTAK